MSKFSIDTDKVENVADDINGLTSRSSSITSSVSGYDTSNEDGFNFSGAKNSIVHNLEGVETKINNTVKMLNVVVGTHSGLQNSVNDTGDSGNKKPTSNYSSRSNDSYSYSGNYTGGGYGDYSPNNSSAYNNAVMTPVSDNKESSKLNSTTSSVDAIPLGLDQMSLSAVELLNSVLSSTSASTSLDANSLLEDKLKDEELASEGLKDTDTKAANEIKPDELEAASNNKTIIVLEKKSTDDATYQTIVTEVANEYKIDFKVLMLDSIIQDKEKTNGLDIKLSSVIEESSLKVNDPTKEEKESDIETEEKEEKSTEANKENDNDEKELESVTKEEQEEQTEDKETEKEESEDKEKSSESETKIDNSDETKTTTPENSKYTILDQDKYNKLTSLKTAGNAKNNLETTPVTLIMRNGVIISSINGVTTKTNLESIIAGLGITKDNVIM